MNDTESQGKNELLESMLGDFLDESDQLLGKLNENLMALDEWVQSLNGGAGSHDENLMNELFRAAHSLKGLSAMLGLNDINLLTHKLENVFDAARSNKLKIDPDAVELMFHSVDRLSALVNLLKDPTAEPVDYHSVIESIRLLLQSANAERPMPCKAEVETAFIEAIAEYDAKLNSGTPITPIPSPEPLLPSSDDNLSSNMTKMLIEQFNAVQDEPNISPKYLSLFVDEADVALDKISEYLLNLETSGQKNELRDLMGIAHQIKGSAATIGLNRMAKHAHLMEDLIQKELDAEGRVSSEAADAMLEGTEELRKYVEQVRKGDHKSDILSNIIPKLAAIHARHAIAKPENDTSKNNIGSNTSNGMSDNQTNINQVELSAEERQILSAASADGVSVYVVRVNFQPLFPLASLKARLIYEKVCNFGEVIFFKPSPQTLDDLETIDVLDFALSSEQAIGMIRQGLQITGVQSLTIETYNENDDSRLMPLPVDSTKTPVNSAATDSASAESESSVPTKPISNSTSNDQRQTNNDKDRPTETVRVDTERLDQLMNLAGQLVINKARFTQIGDSLKNQLHSARGLDKIDNVMSILEKMAVDGDEDLLNNNINHNSVRTQLGRVSNDLKLLRFDMQSYAQAHTHLGDLSEAIHQLDRVSAEIQQSVMATRMVPIGPLFTRFKRVVRDIARSSGKDIRLVIRGEKTELDKRLIDELSDPLTHAIRNAADHGIESPEERLAAGKPAEGTVVLEAFHRGNSIIIQVSDDGKGLNTERITNKCLEKGLLTEADVLKMTPKQIWQLVWAPGFSTAEKVTEVSGRGMGMDIVRSKITNINGTVELDSVPGQSATLIIKLPLTLAILPSLMVEIDQDCFSLPMESVKEIVRIPKEDAVSIQGQTAVCVRNRVIVMKSLDEILTWHSSDSSTKDQESGQLTLVIVGEPGHELALIVNRVLGEEDVVIKSISENYRNVPGIAGATVLGNGRVSLILDIPCLIDSISDIHGILQTV